MSIPEIIAWPFAKMLLLFYEVFSNYGIAIILFSIVIKLVFLPFQMKSKRSMMRSGRLAPLIKDLEKKHGDDKQKYQEAVSKLYKEEGVNPMSGCLWSILPLIVMMMLYNVIRQPLTTLMGIGTEALGAVKNVIEGMGVAAQGVTDTEIAMADFIHKNFGAFEGISNKLIDLDFSFLGMNLGNTPQWQVWNFDWSDPAVWGPAVGLFLIPVVSTLFNYVSMKVSTVNNPATTGQQNPMKGMMLVMPLMSLWFGFTWPAALGLYWIMNSILATIQDFILNKHYGKILDAEDAERRERMRKQEEELERKRLETERLREIGATEKNKNTSKKKIQAAEKAKSDERAAAERAAEKARRRAELGISDDMPESQVGNRRYARGRAYVMDRYTNPEGAEEATRDAAERAAIDEQVDREFAAQDDGTPENVESADE